MDRGKARTLVDCATQGAGVGCDRCRWFTRTTITDAVEQLDFSSLLPPQTYALRIMGDSMIEDFNYRRMSNYATSTRTGSTEKWRCSKSRRTRHFGSAFIDGDRVTLKPANSNTSRLEVAAMQVQVRVLDRCLARLRW